MSKIQVKYSALKREHPSLKNMKFRNFFLSFLWVISALPDPDRKRWCILLRQSWYHKHNRIIIIYLFAYSYILLLIIDQILLPAMLCQLWIIQNILPEYDQLFFYYFVTLSSKTDLNEKTLFLLYCQPLRKKQNSNSNLDL
jgi:hypothetical protein